jgi:hypothetical protein
MNGAYAEAGGWIIDVDDNTTDGSMIVTVSNKLLYLYFWCGGAEILRAASRFIRSAPQNESLRIGSFCRDLHVELDCFRREPDVVYLSVTRPDEQSMAYCLRNEDRIELAAALLEVADSLTKKSG